MNSEVVHAILNMLRDARAMTYRDAESFDQAVAVLEHIGQLLAGEVRIGLGAYEGVILGLARQAPHSDARYLRELFRTVRDARNDSVHTGDFIRHHVLRLMELFLILEEAVSMNGRVASDLMVRNPVIAEGWHNIATVRRNMLLNAFSFLPVKVGDRWDCWKLISDRSIVRYLMCLPNAERNRRLGATVESLLPDRLELEIAPKVPPDTTVDKLQGGITHLPLLVVDEQRNLLGILTAFDLL